MTQTNTKLLKSLTLYIPRLKSISLDTVGRSSSVDTSFNASTSINFIETEVQFIGEVTTKFNGKTSVTEANVAGGLTLSGGDLISNNQSVGLFLSSEVTWDDIPMDFDETSEVRKFTVTTFTDSSFNGKTAFSTPTFQTNLTANIETSFNGKTAVSNVQTSSFLSVVPTTFNGKTKTGTIQLSSVFF